MSDGLQHEAAVPRRLRNDFEMTPSQQRMGPERVPRRNPSTDQKKARTQQARQSTKESTMAEQVNVETDLLARMAAAPTLEIQRGLAAELAVVRQAQAASLRSQAEFGVSKAALAALHAAPAPSFVHHTAASDWIGEVADEGLGDTRTVEATMRAEASLWYEARPDAVKVDAMERNVQADGVARRLASQYAAAAGPAYQSFMAQVAHLAGLDTRAAALRQAADAPKGPKVTQDLANTHVPSGSSLPEGVTNKDTFDDSLLTAPGGPDPKSTTNDGETPSLSEGDAPEGDHSEGIENPAADTKNDKATGDTYTDPNPSGGKSASAHTAENKYVCQYCDYVGTPAEQEAHLAKEGPQHKSGGTVTDQMNTRLNKGSARKVADDQKSPSADAATPSLSEGTTPEGDHAEPYVNPAMGTGHDAGPGNDVAIDSIDGTVYPKQASLSAIAASVRPEPASAPFLKAMAALTSVEGNVAGVPGRDIVAYVLRTASLSEGQRSLLERHLAGEVPPQFLEQQKKKSDDGDSDDKGDKDSMPDFIKKKIDGDKDIDSAEDSDEDKDADKPWEKNSSLFVDPVLMRRVQANIKTALPGYLDELEPAEQYAEGRIEGTDAAKASKPYADGLADGAEGKPASHQYDFHA